MWTVQNVSGPPLLVLQEMEVHLQGTVQQPVKTHKLALKELQDYCYGLLTDCFSTQLTSLAQMLVQPCCSLHLN